MSAVVLRHLVAAVVAAALWSLEQDETGEAHCTHKMRFHSGWGILAFAATVTLSGVALDARRCNTMVLGDLRHVFLRRLRVGRRWPRPMSSRWSCSASAFCATCCTTISFIILGMLLFAFTLFHAYVEFAQYFVVWNGNMPDETFWYIIREHGSWWWVSMIMIFGHFLLPFFVLLPIARQIEFQNHAAGLRVGVADAFRGPGVQHLAGGASATAIRSNGLWLQFGCLAFMGGLLGWVFLKNSTRTRRIPQKDPRLLEAWALPEYEDLDRPQTTGGRTMNQETNHRIQNGAAAAALGFIVACFIFAAFVLA